MSERITRIINGVIEREGGYVNHPSDPGGATMYGITERVARAAGYRGDMRAMPRETAFRIYWNEFVIDPAFDQVATIDAKVAEELVDTGVNCGTARAQTWFQQALNALNSRGRDYPDIKVDGDVGPATLGAFRAFKRRRAAMATTIMLHAIDAFQGAHYLSLARDNNQFEDFLNGWLAHRIRNVAA